MKCLIGGKQYSKSKILYRQLGFGENDVQKPIHRYEMILTLDEFSHIIESAYEEYLEDLRTDEQLTGEPDDVGLKELDYPSFMIALSENKKFLALFVKEYLFFELLERCFGKNSEADCQFVINTLDDVEIGHTVKFRGEVFEI